MKKFGKELKKRLKHINGNEKIYFGKDYKKIRLATK